MSEARGVELRVDHQAHGFGSMASQGHALRPRALPQAVVGEGGQSIWNELNLSLYVPDRLETCVLPTKP